MNALSRVPAIKPSRTEGKMISFTRIQVPSYKNEEEHIWHQPIRKAVRVTKMVKTHLSTDSNNSCNERSLAHAKVDVACDGHAA